MSSITSQQATIDLELFPRRKGWRLENVTGDSILERLKENLRFKLSWMLLLLLRDILHFLPLQMFKSPEMMETKAYKTYLGYATGVTPPKKARKFKKLASPKLTTVPASPKEPIKKSKRVKRPAKKSTNAPTTCVVIRDTPGVSVSKKKAPAKADRGKKLTSFNQVAQVRDLILNQRFSESDNQSWGYSEDENESDYNDDEGNENDDNSGNDAQDSKRAHSDEEENPNLNLNDVNVRSKVAVNEELRKGDVEMPDATRESGSQENAINESLENVILAKSSFQPKSTYEAAASLTEFELKKILLDKIQKRNQGNDDEEVASKRDWFIKPKQPQEPIDPDWNVGKTPQQGPTQSWLMTHAATADKPLKSFNELMSTPIDFSAYIMNNLNITILTQETLLGLAFKLLKGRRTNFAKLVLGYYFHHIKIIGEPRKNMR
nr:hypothetical protein [Tanacetum cinerariifolium]